MSDRITLYRLTASAAEDARERIAYAVSAEKAPGAKYDAMREAVENIPDAAHEIADGTVPVYTSDLMELAAYDIYLATEEPEGGPAFDGTPTPVNIVAANVYERLYEAANIDADTDTIDEAESDDHPYIVAYDTAREFFAPVVYPVHHTASTAPAFAAIERDAARALALAHPSCAPDPLTAVLSALVEDGEISEGDAAYIDFATDSETNNERRAALLAAYDAGRLGTDYTPPALAAMIDAD